MRRWRAWTKVQRVGGVLAAAGGVLFLAVSLNQARGRTGRAWAAPSWLQVEADSDANSFLQQSTQKSVSSCISHIWNCVDVSPLGCLCAATTAFDICACICVQSCSQSKFLRGVPVTPDTPLAPILQKGWAHYGPIPQNPGFLSWAGKYRLCSCDHVLMCHGGSLTGDL